LVHRTFTIKKTEMMLKLIISDNCKACERAAKVLRNIQVNNPQIITEIININSYNAGRILITPALIVNNQLFSYGDIDVEKLLSKIN